MSLRRAVLLSLAGGAALILACGGDTELVLEDGSPTPTGTTSASQQSPTPSTSPQASPGGSTPTTTPTPEATATPADEVEVIPVAEPFEVEVSAGNSGLRVRETPSTVATILGAIYVGDRATVLGEAHGEEVESGKGDLWYQVDVTQDGVTIRGFVYAPFVEEAE